MRAHYPIKYLCSYLEVSRSGFYKWNGKVSDSETILFSELDKEIISIHEQHPAYGVRRIWKLLNLKNIKCARLTVQRRMQKHQIRAKIRTKTYKHWIHEDHDEKYFRDKIKRNFIAEIPNQKWCTDITYLPFGSGRLYMVAIIDLFDRSIISYKISRNMEMHFVEQCIDEAMKRSNFPKNVTLHSDRGIHFSCNRYKKKIKEYGIIGSHSRKGNCWDNACIESFFSILKSESIYLNNPKSADAMTNVVSSFMLHYNTERINQFGNGLPPIIKRNRFYQSVSGHLA